MALANRSVELFLEDSGLATQFPDVLSIQSQFLGATQAGWSVEFSVEAVKKGKKLVFMALKARRTGTIDLFFTANYVYGSLSLNRANAEFEPRRMPRLPPITECVEYGSPFDSKYFDYKLSFIPKGTDPFRGKQKTAAYVGWRDGRTLDLASAVLLGDIWTDFRIFNEAIPLNGSVRASGSITMSVSFLNRPSEGCRFFVVDMEFGVTGGVGDYSLFMVSSTFPGLCFDLCFDQRFLF